jgi:hypothetical protein
MKRVLLILAASFSFSAVLAQQDSSRQQIDTDTVRKAAPLKLPDASPANSTVPSLNSSSNQYTADPMIKITIDDVPASMRKTLEEEQYSGWQHSPVYRNSKTNEYSIDVRKGTQTKTYRFDKNGKAIHPDTPNDDQN